MSADLPVPPELTGSFDSPGAHPVNKTVIVSKTPIHFLILFIRQGSFRFYFMSARICSAAASRAACGVLVPSNASWIAS